MRFHKKKVAGFLIEKMLQASGTGKEPVVLPAEYRPGPGAPPSTHRKRGDTSPVSGYTDQGQWRSVHSVRHSR